MEICVDSVTSALNAVKGGASRIELCSSLSEGGLTPSLGLLKKIKQLIDIPVFVMIRPRTGDDFKYSPEEVDVMEMDIISLKDSGADGFVFGALTQGNEVDIETCHRLLKAVEGLPTTFHRAFDMVPHPLKALETIIGLGFKRILTSGQEATAYQGIPLLKQLVDQSKGRIVVMPGAGVTQKNIGTILQETKAQEIHGSAKTSLRLNVNSASRAASCFQLNVTCAELVEGMVTDLSKIVNQND